MMHETILDIPIVLLFNMLCSLYIPIGNMCSCIVSKITIFNSFGQNLIKYTYLHVNARDVRMLTHHNVHYHFPKCPRKFEI